MQRWIESLDAKLAIAGLMGGILALAVRPTKSIWGGFITIIAGLGCAIYITPLVNHLLNLPEDLLGGLGFLVGLAALPFAGWFLRRISKFLDRRFNDPR